MAFPRTRPPDARPHVKANAALPLRAVPRTIPLARHSELHAPRPPARDVRPAQPSSTSGADTPAGRPGDRSGYRCRSGQHVWPTARDARRCCNGFVRVTLADALRGIYDRWERDAGCWHDATYTPTRVDPLDPDDPETRLAFPSAHGGAEGVGPC